MMATIIACCELCNSYNDGVCEFQKMAVDHNEVCYAFEPRKEGYDE